MGRVYAVGKPRRYLSWVIGGAAFALFCVLWLLINFRLDHQWFSSVGYSAVYWQSILWRVLVGLGIFAVTFVFSFLHLQFTLRRAGYRQRRKTLAAGLALFFGLSIWLWAGDAWFMILQALHYRAFGTVDPQFGLDVAFYVFQLPFLDLLHNCLTTLLTLHLAATVAIYLMAGAGRLTQTGEPEVELAGGSGRYHQVQHMLADWPGWSHCLVLLGGVVILQGAGHLLQLFHLLYSQRGIVAGAGATDIAVRLPCSLLLTGLSLLTGIFLFLGSRRRLKPAIVTFGIYLMFSLLLNGVVPGLYQQFVIDPNEISREQPYIQRNITYTNQAYNLNKVEEREYPVGTLTAAELEENRDVVENIRILDQSATHTTYSQQQELRRYYTFADVDVDRYEIDGRYTQVMVSAREMDQKEIPEQSRNFNNLLFQYTHGFGLAMSPANRVSATGLPDYLVKDIPPVSQGLEISQPRIYFGEMTANNVIVKTKLAELDYTDGDNNQDYFYEGQGGIPMTLMNRLLLSLRDTEYRYLFSGYITGESLYLETRNVVDRAARITPFLNFDSDPYVVISDDGQLIYMLDAYTQTARYPYSQAYRTDGSNYLRNSVKVTVNAYSGAVNYYIFDPEDPIVATYAAIYPGLFQERTAMPEDLQRHVRYPEAMFQIQSRMLQDYHMSNPVVFYNREDRWAFADQVIGDQRKEQDPYYTISRLPGESKEEFVLLRNFTPYGRDNMVAWLAGRSDGDYYGKLLLYTFSKGSQIMGPMQVESQIDQNPEISSQLSLWGQGGSTLIRGNMLVYPVDDALLYVEPLYLSSENNRYPQLLRLFVYYNDRIVMAESLEAALAQLFPGYVLSRSDSSSANSDDHSPGTAGMTGTDISAPGGAASDGQGDQGGQSQQEQLPADIESQIQRLLQLQEEGKAALAQGDWSAYGQAQAAMENILKELAAGVGQ